MKGHYFIGYSRAEAAAGRPGAGVAGPGVVPAVAVGPVPAVLAAKCAVNFAFAGRYGWQRDELYYAAAGRHLQGGYVEFPPVTALLSAAARGLSGWSLAGFRGFAILAGVATIVLAALVARELGGGRGAQMIAAAAAAFSPLLPGSNGLFQPVSFDQATTMLVLWLALRLALGRGSWLALGAAAGIGLETKYTLAVVLIVLVAGVAAWRRDLLAPGGFVFAVLLAGALMVPNLIWEAGHGWVSVHWFLRPPASATGGSRPQYIVNLLQQADCLAVPVAVAGAVTLLRDRRLRPPGAAAAGVPAACFLPGGKSCYALPAVLFAVAAGAVPFGRWAASRRLPAAAAALGYVIAVAVSLPGTLPVLPLQSAIRHGVVKARAGCQDELAGRPSPPGWDGWRAEQMSSWRATTERRARSSCSGTASHRSPRPT